MSEKMEYRILEGKEGVRRAYDDMTESYDYSDYFYWTRRLEEGEERAIKKWLNKVLAPILDVGCGTGRYSLRKAVDGSEVVALDISLKMLKRTVEKAKTHNCYHNIHPILADGENLPFTDKAFNGLICTLTFDHFEKCEKSIQEFSRVLKSYGLYIVTTFNKHTLDDLKRRLKIPLDKVPFQTENMPPTLIYEVGHSAEEVKELSAKYKFNVLDAKGCCYWHLIGSEDTKWARTFAKHYKIELDSLFNIFKPLLKHAEIHALLMRKIDAYK